MRWAGPLASWLTNKPARVKMRDLIVSQPGYWSPRAVILLCKIERTRKYFLVLSILQKKECVLARPLAPNVILRLSHRRAGPFLPFI